MPKNPSIIPLREPNFHIQLKSPADDFVDNRLPAILDLDHPPPYYSPIRRGSIAIADSKEVAAASKAFNETLQTFYEKRKSRGFHIDIVLGSKGANNDWTTVVAALEDAEKKYESVKDEGRLGQIRHCLRKWRDAQGTVESWLRLLPSDSWQGSVICGGLKIIVGVAYQLGEIRDLICRTIAQIPSTIDSAMRLSKIYPNEVTEYAAQVMVATFQIMKSCLDFFMKNPIKKVLGAAVRGKEYGRSLADKLEDLEILQRKMDRAASTTSQERQYESQELLKKHVVNSRVQMDKLREDLTNNFRKMLVDKIRPTESQYRRQVEQNEADRRQIAQDRKEYLLMSLDFDEDVSSRDVLNCLRLGSTLSLQAQDRALSILYSSQVQQWVYSVDSVSLVINAMEGSGVSRHSTASCFSAHLLLALNDDNQDSITLSWFCGEHIHVDVEIMVADLLGQLLISGMDDVQMCKALPTPHRMPQDKRSLYDLFFRLLQHQLEKTPIYCIIDSASLYENAGRVDDLLDFWEGLATIAIKQLGHKMMHPLRIMATSPMQCLRLGTQHDGTQPIVFWARDATSLSGLYSISNVMQNSHEAA